MKVKNSLKVRCSKSSLVAALLFGLIALAPSLQAQTLNISGSTYTLDGSNPLSGYADVTFSGGGILQYTAADLTDYAALFANNGGGNTPIWIDTNSQNVIFNNAFGVNNNSGFTKDGLGTLTINADNGNVLSAGRITVNAGTLVMGNGGAIGYPFGGLTVNTSGTLDVNGVGNVYIKDNGLTGGGTIINNSSSSDSTLNLWTGAGWTTTFSGSLQNGATKKLTLQVGGFLGADSSAIATLNMAGVSTVFDFNLNQNGAINVTGTVNVMDYINLGNNGPGTLTVNGGLVTVAQQLILGHNGVGTLNLTNGGVMSSNLINFGGGRVSYINLDSGGAYCGRIYGMSDGNAADGTVITMTNGGTWSPKYQGGADAWIDTDTHTSLQIGSGGGIIDLRGGLANLVCPITDVAGQSGALTIQSTPANSWGWNSVQSISGTNTYSGGTTLKNVAVTVNSTSPFGTGALNITQGSWIHLNNKSITVGGLLGDSTGVIANSSAGTAVLTVDMATSGTYAGHLYNEGGSGSANKLALVKTGSGTLTLTNNDSNYSGGTTINGGVLQMSGNSDAISHPSHETRQRGREPLNYRA